MPDSHKYSQRIPMVSPWMPNGNPKKPVETSTGLVWPGLFHAADWLPTLLCAAGADPILAETGTILNGASWDVRKSWENHGKTMGHYTLYIKVYSWENHRTKWWILQLTMFDYRYLMICHEVRSQPNRSSQWTFRHAHHSNSLFLEAPLHSYSFT